MYRNNPLGSVLVSIFFLLSLTACGLSVLYYLSTRQAQDMQKRYLAIQGTMNGMQLLVAESIEFSKRDPDLDRLLQELKVKPVAAAPPAQPQPARPAR